MKVLLSSPLGANYINAFIAKELSVVTVSRQQGAAAKVRAEVIVSYGGCGIWRSRSVIDAVIGLSAASGLGAGAAQMVLVINPQRGYCLLEVLVCVK
eukprot:4140510-Ditylum_brightwellii.AAC.2